jgi:biotin carboxyl carrier protein
MKKMRITLNEKIYEVIVEVLEDDEQAYPGATVMPMQVQRSASAPVRSTAPAAAPRPKAPTAGGNAVMAPIVGTVTKILVKPGQEVKANEALIVLDAMKMDTYINAPKAGTVQTIECQVGDSVSVGQKLLTLS